MAKQPLVGTRPLLDLAAEVREIPLRRRHCGRVIVDGDVDDTVGDLRLERADFTWLVHTETAAFDHRGTAHRDVRAGDADDDVTTPEDGCVPGEAIPRRDPDERHQPAQPREVVERETVEARHTEPVGVTRTPSSSFGEEDDGQELALGDLEQSVFLLVAEQPLGAGEDRVVVRHRDDLGHGAHAAHEPVGRRALDELLERATSALRGHDEWSVLDERSVVDEVGDVLPRRTPARVVAPSDGVLTAVIVGAFVPVEHRGEVGTHGSEVDLAGAGLDKRSRTGGWNDRQQWFARRDRRSHLRRHLVHHAPDVRGDDVLHLHRLEHGDLLAALHRVTRRHVDRDDRPLDRCRHDVHRVFLWRGALSCQRHHPIEPGDNVGVDLVTVDLVEQFVARVDVVPRGDVESRVA